MVAEELVPEGPAVSYRCRQSCFPPTVKAMSLNAAPTGEALRHHLSTPPPFPSEGHLGTSGSPGLEGVPSLTQPQ